MSTMGPVSNPETAFSSECAFKKQTKTTVSKSRFVSEQTTQVGAKRRGRPTTNAARERTRVKTLRSAFLDLQRSLPAVPPDTKLSKLDVLVLATTYISHLMKTLNFVPTTKQDSERHEHLLNGPLHPVKKWPMRTRLYAGIVASAKTPPLCTENEISWTRFPSSP